jgi:phospholipid/cholesterol/gamma-HCH transport system substrate-binding protein
MGRDKHALITGLFLIVFVVGITAIIYWIGHFERQRNVYVISTRDSVSGLNPESTVFYRGISVGKVINIRFDPNDTGVILVSIEVDKDIIFTKGVFARLRYKGVTGLTQIQLDDSRALPAVLMSGEDPLSRIPLVPSMSDKLMSSGEELLQKADYLMVRLGALLNDKNSKNIGDILENLNTLTNQFSELQNSLDKALAGVPLLTKDAQRTLVQINTLTQDLQGLTRDVQNLSIKTGHLVATGDSATDMLLQTTLPKANKMLAELQEAAQQVKRTAAMLDNNPQALLLGPDDHDSGPGEPGYKEPKR